MHTSQHTTAIVSQARTAEFRDGWQRTAVEEITARIADPGFPCVFSRNALRKELLGFVFVADGGADGIRHLAGALGEYVERARDWDGQLDTAYPLVVVFAPDAVPGDSVEEHHAFGWHVLRELHRADPAPWPAGVAPRPDDETWSMCFDGMPLFCNMSSPAHRVRRSRNLGRSFVLVVNPRERFDVFAGDTPSGRKVRANIRGRIHRYDGVPHAPQLGSYGIGALEWQQYGLIEENARRTDACPFPHHADDDTQRTS
ncbi:YqcI/YcgG family protein [Streptomyces racemochromogenes]|uniref:YqcI/YcgG family protein n=1 Tax=Streptomyces racemochromogenes TaxID=67353 RepID=A0ABW7PFB6_9ACTN